MKNHVHIRKVYVDIRKVHVDIRKVHVHIRKVYVHIRKVHATEPSDFLLTFEEKGICCREAEDMSCRKCGWEV